MKRKADHNAPGRETRNSNAARVRALQGEARELRAALASSRNTAEQVVLYRRLYAILNELRLMLRS